MPNTAPNIASRSTQVLCRTADSEPSSTPATNASEKASSPSWTETGKKRAMTSLAVTPRLKLGPKSKRVTIPTR